MIGLCDIIHIISIHLYMEVIMADISYLKLRNCMYTHYKICLLLSESQVNQMRYVYFDLKQISYKVSIQIAECPRNKEDWNRYIIISPIGLNERLNINLQMICECECELPENEVLVS